MGPIFEYLVGQTLDIWLMVNLRYLADRTTEDIWLVGQLWVRTKIFGDEQNLRY